MSTVHDVALQHAIECMKHSKEDMDPAQIVHTAEAFASFLKRDPLIKIQLDNIEAQSRNTMPPQDDISINGLGVGNIA